MSARRIVPVLAVAVMLASGVMAHASVSMTTTPTATISDWVLQPTGANQRSGGTVTINATEPYEVTMTADKTRLSEWDTGTSSYVTDGETLGAAPQVTAARTGGTALVPGVGATATIGVTDSVATGTGLGTDEYAITLSQATTILDKALPGGRTYHIVLTYTASATL